MPARPEQVANAVGGHCAHGRGSPLPMGGATTRAGWPRRRRSSGHGLVINQPIRGERVATTDNNPHSVNRPAYPSHTPDRKPAREPVRQIGRNVGPTCFRLCPLRVALSGDGSAPRVGCRSTYTNATMCSIIGRSGPDRRDYQTGCKSVGVRAANGGRRRRLPRGGRVWAWKSIRRYCNRPSTRKCSPPAARAARKVSHLPVRN